MSQSTLDAPVRQDGAPPGSPSAPPGVKTGAAVNYASRSVRRPRSRFNLRIIILLTVVAVPFAGVLYLFLAPMINGGITQHGDYAEVDLKALGNFPFDETNGTIDDVPSRWRGLDGKRIVLRGYMYCLSSAEKTRNFQFVYNVAKCCFAGPPRVQERVFAHSREPVTLYDYTTQLVRLTGKLHVRVMRDSAGVVQSVFDLEVERVDPLT